ncbi:hypothetical protein NLI96_g3920 [Meripilus lineatus]|uniref:Uncharacterized protein n=1 Tax=Meripilus lineatus TaxID=2056292 RepID=A0AAD5YF94_9APHY|nr:hypothetical protein NLI96_g3920 [Physisporinus lineatus]
MKVTIAVLSAGLFAAQVAASANFIRSLEARQTIDPSSIPAGCEGTCTPVLTTLNVSRTTPHLISHDVD